MIYFVNVYFQQKDGAIGHTSTNFTNEKDACMEYHSQLAGIYTPENRENNQWAIVQILTQDGRIAMQEHAKFDALAESA